MSSINVRKNELRSEIKRLRSEISKLHREQKNSAIQRNLLSLVAVQNAKSVFCFISHGSEVDTHGIINQLAAQKQQLAVPKIMESNTMNAILFRNWQELEAGQLGILTPRDNTGIIEEIDVTITPGLGFTAGGSRLGYGRGYYDSWFQRYDVGLKIALAYELQIQIELPSDEHDINVDMIVTEERVIRV